MKPWGWGSVPIAHFGFQVDADRLEELLDRFAQRVGLAGEGVRRLLKQAGSAVWAQDEASCVIYGMPMAVAKANLADGIYPLDDIGRYLAEIG